MSNKYRILIVESQTLIRAGIKSLLSFQDTLEVIGEAGTGREALHLAKELKPDLILIVLSVSLMNQFEPIWEIRRRWKTVKIVILAVDETEEYVSLALKAGVNGYVSQNSTPEELFQAINLVLSGKRVLSHRITDKIVDRYLRTQKERSVRIDENLSRREKEILMLVGEGHRNKNIADSLGISVRTVEKHRSNIMEKLDLHSTPALTAFAIEKGLVPLASFKRSHQQNAILTEPLPGGIISAHPSEYPKTARQKGPIHS